MRRFALISCLVLSTLALSATVASAETSTHQKFSFSVDFTAPAGTFCDFTYHDSFTVDVNEILFGDPNNPTRIIDQVTEFVTHVYVDTGYTLTEVDHFTNEYDLTGPKQQAREVGIVWHLRDRSGKLVVVQAGQLLFDLNTGELLKATPNLNPDAAAVICPALGGQPAI
jgi:hypothetical protein